MTTWNEILRDLETVFPDPEVYRGTPDVPIISYPPPALQFRAFELTPFESIKCVILGQDPYHTPGVANGLAFSTSFGNSIPPSLRNIFKEYKADLHFPTPRSGDLSNWARNGVLLLNTALTVRSGEPGSHLPLWSSFTQKVIERIVHEHSNLVFILWGRHAQAFAPLISVNGRQGHSIIRSAHPSPYSANNGFFGSRPFSRTNAFLVRHRHEPINWRLE